MDNYNFEEFKSVGSRFNIAISVGRAQRLYLGNAFYRKYNVGSMGGVKLLYDKSKNAVGFKFIKDNEEGMVKIKKLRDQSAYINAKAFFGMYDINSDKYLGRYTPKEITDNSGQKVFVIELKEHQDK